MLFFCCFNLTSITIPKSVTSVGDYAFMYCESLTDVYYTGTETEWESIEFGTNVKCLINATVHYNYDPSHVHKYTAKVTTAATCTTDGEKTYTCTCGESYTETISATDHAYKTNKVEPTYSEGGYTEFKYINCDYSYKDLFTDRKTLATPKIKSFSPNENSITVKWNKISGADGYRIYRYDSKIKKYVAAATIKNSSTVSYKDTKLKAGTTYKYKVKAYVKENGSTVWSGVSKVYTAATKPSAVKFTKTSSFKSAVKLTWGKVNCTGYTVQQYNTKTKKWVIVKNVNAAVTSYKITGLKKNTSYKFRIRAYKTIGSTKIYSTWSVTQTVKTTK